MDYGHRLSAHILNDFYRVTLVISISGVPRLKFGGDGVEVEVEKTIWSHCYR